MRSPIVLTSVVLAAAVLAGCSSHPAVEQYGAMRPVMREGKTEARISLSDAVRQPHAIGVGALEGLAGEITIVDGDVWVARPSGGALRMDGPEPLAGDHATLLTLAHVSNWHPITISKRVEGAALDALIEQVARAVGLDVTRPFPFVIEGRVRNLDLHVINGYCPIANDPTTMPTRPWRWSSDEETEVVIVGFYAPGAGGTMTHHGTAIHAHALVSTTGRIITGHIDHVVVEAGMKLSVPDAE